MSKYAALVNHLSALATDEVQLSFASIEEIIADRLPESAHKYPAWWSNSRTDDSHTWAHHWLEAGWEKSRVDLREGSVIFRRVRFFDIDAQAAREGYERDQMIMTRGRNARLAQQRKELDNFSCQACGFRLQLVDRFVIEVHHCDPLSLGGERITTIDELVSLCPTCHRIAHLRSTPFSVTEIKRILNTVSR